MSDTDEWHRRVTPMGDGQQNDSADWQGGHPQTTDPYAVPGSASVRRSIDWRAKDQSISAEPWFTQVDFSLQPSDLSPGQSAPETWEGRLLGLAEQELAEHSVWDEPSVSRQLHPGPGPEALTWFRFYLESVSRTPAYGTWLVTAGLVLLSGPLAVLGVLFTGFVGDALLMVVFFGPTIEELLKIALPLWVVEKRPWLFSSGWQILLCGAGAGFTFAAIENGIYLTVYIPDPSPALVAWRWSVGVALHVGCSMIASVGLVGVRRGMLQRGNPPQLYDGGRWIIAAIVIHGIYNLLAIFWQDRF